MKSPATAPDRRARSVVRTAIVAAVAAVVLAALYFAFGRNSANALAETAREAVAARRFDQARGVIAKWLAKDPDAAEAYYLLARVEVAADRSQEAVNALARALELGHPPSELAPYHAVIQSRSDQAGRAEPILRRALEDSDAPMPEVAQALARVYLSTFRLPEAAEPIARWMKDAPDDPRPYLWRNEIDLRSDADHSVVIQNYKAALRRDPNHAEARLGLADRLRLANRLDEAAAEFDAYIKLKPDDPEGYVGAGRVALVQGRNADAAKLFDRALERNPREPVALKERGVIDLNDRKYESARDRLRRVLEIDPYDPDTHYKLARALQGLKDYDGARAEDAAAQRLLAEHSRMIDLRSALVKKPKDLALRLETAEWLLTHGHDDEGKTWCDQILRDHPGNVPTLKLLVDYHGRKKDMGQANYYRLLLRQAESGSPSGSP